MLAIGYIRISTTLKRQDEQALTTQAEKIREACRGQCFHLAHIYEDIGSACPADSLKRRPGLQVALREAASQNAVIVVTEPSRLFRHPSEALTVSSANPTVRFWSVQHLSFLTPEQLQVEATHAAAEADAIRVGASKAQVSRGFKGPKPEAKIRGSRQSLKSRKSRASARIEALADLLEKHDPHGLLTRAQAAQLFNSNGLQTSQRLKWDKQNVRRDLAAARRVIQEREEMALLMQLNQAA